MKVMHNIIKVEVPDRDFKLRCGEDVTGQKYRFVTNFPATQLVAYAQAVATYDEPGDFGISSDAWGFGQDGAFRTQNFAFYARDYGDSLGAFWEHLEKLLINYQL